MLIMPIICIQIMGWRAEAGMRIGLYIDLFGVEGVRLDLNL